MTVKMWQNHAKIRNILPNFDKGQVAVKNYRTQQLLIVIGLV